MPTEVDKGFFERADEHIHLSNGQISGDVGRGKVSASMMYATARFNAWVSACGFDDGQQLTEHKAETIEYFVEQYRQMLSENIDEYANNFVNSMKAGQGGG